MWRSLVAHLTGGQGVAGSNPVIPTETSRKLEGFRDFLGRGIESLIETHRIELSAPALGGTTLIEQRADALVASAARTLAQAAGPRLRSF